MKYDAQCLFTLWKINKNKIEAFSAGGGVRVESTLQHISLTALLSSEDNKFQHIWALGPRKLATHTALAMRY